MMELLDALIKIIAVDLRNLDHSLRHTDAVIDHQSGEARTIDETDFADRLCTGREHLKSIFVGEPERGCGCIVNQLGGCSLWIPGEESKDCFDELIAGWNRHWQRIVPIGGYSENI